MEGPGTDNTIVTIGDINYLWGIFLLIASARKAGMREPFLVGCKRFTPRARHILEGLGDVRFADLDSATRSLTCYKPFTMLQADTKFVTWADSDAFFTGNVSGILPPDNEDEMHFRMRPPSELPGLIWKRHFGGDLTAVPKQVLDAWRQDVEETGGGACAEPRFTTTGSACFCSLSLARHREFLEVWHRLQMKVLPDRDVGVADRSLRFYPQLDESTLNACLAFWPDAPRVQDVFRMNKERDRLFVHFIARPKPWEGWTKRSFRFFDEYVSVVEWAASQGLELPGPIPGCLMRSRKGLMRALIPWMTLKPKIAKRLKRFF
jgi:hypothetical protein